MNYPKSSTQIPFDMFSDTVALSINPAVIDERLHALWAQSAPEIGSDITYTRLSLANLVVLADESSQKEAELLILQFAQKRPSRTILITLSSENEDSTRGGVRAEKPLTADVAIACNLGAQNHGMLCWERIGIEAPIARIRQIPNAIRALASGTNQLVLVDLTSKQFSAEIDNEFSALADYHFFDSSANRRKITQHLKRSSKTLAGVFDLAYERSHPLREAIKFAFDDPRITELIPKLQEITIALSSNSFKQERRVFAYLAGWLAAKLHLVPTGEMQRRSLSYKNSAGKTLTIRTVESGVNNVELEVRFRFSDETFRSVTICSSDFLSVTRANASEFHFAIQYNDEAYAEFASPCLSDAEYMLRRLGDVRRRTDYTETLGHTRVLLAGLSKESAV